MISVNEALQQVRSAVRILPTRTERLMDAAGKYLAEAIVATHDSPPFDTSAMDGFAVRVADLGGALPDRPIRLPMAGEVAAGESRPYKLPGGTTLRINTGAPLPEFADAVVRIEDVKFDGDMVLFTKSVAAGHNLRRRGEDFGNGDQVLEAGRRLDSTAIGVAASVGRASVPVRRRPRVALFSTGDELLEPGEDLVPGSIYNSSRFALAPLLKGFGAEVYDLGKIPDDERATASALSEGLDFDVAVTTGGVSMGSRDFVRPALLKLGVEETFWKVNQRPGKPLFFGTTSSCLVFGLPGNPVSVFVTALVYVRTALLALQGASKLELGWIAAEAAADFRKDAGITVFARADIVSGGGGEALPKLVPSTAQGSHQFSGLSASDGIVWLEEDWANVAKGRPLRFLPISRF